MTAMYPDRGVGLGEASEQSCRTTARSEAPGPTPLLPGDRVQVHTASCESPDQHLRVALGGTVIERYADGATLAQMDDGGRYELCPWFTSDCPNAVAVASEVAA